MNLLLTFDSTAFTKHLENEDDQKMVRYIILEYGPALQHAIRFFDGDAAALMRDHYDEAYLSAVMRNEDNYINDEPDDARSFIKRTVDEEGNVHSVKGRYNELVDACVDHFNNQVIAVLRNIQNQCVRIYTVIVVGYADQSLNLMLTTDKAIQP